MKKRNKDVFAQFDELQKSVALEIDATKIPFDNDVREVKQILKEGNAFQLMREGLVPQGSPLDKLLNFAGIKSVEKKRSDKLNKILSTYNSNEPNSFMGKVYSTVGDFIAKTKEFIDDPDRGGAVWNFVKPILVTSAVAVAKTSLQRSVAGVFSLPLRLFSRKKKK